jgi:hypothetical protein
MSHRKLSREFLLALLSVCFLVLAVLASSAFAGLQEAAKPALTNDDVVKMVQVKLGDGVIIAKIKSSACKFDTSTDALIKLKEAGVSDAVMQAMAEAAGAATSAAAPAAHPPDPNDPNAEHDPGIYYLHETPEGRRMVQLEPTAYSGAKSGGIFKSAMTYGIAKAKWKAVVRGARASVRTTEPTPTFYFYFEQKHGTLSYAGVPASAYMFGGLSTPSQFTLVRLESKKNNRELIVGEWGAYRASSGTREKDVVEFDLVKASPGIYRVVPRSNLQPGEYCFFNTGQTGTTVGMAGPVGGGGGGGMLFDFGVNPAE